MNLQSLLKDGKKLQLLESRLGDLGQGEISTINTSPIRIPTGKSEKEATIATLEDHIPTQLEMNTEENSPVSQIFEAAVPSLTPVAPTAPPTTTADQVIIVLDGSTDASSPSRSNISALIHTSHHNPYPSSEKRKRVTHATDEENNTSSRDGFESLEGSRSMPSKSRKANHGNQISASNDPHDYSPLQQNGKQILNLSC